MTRKDFHSDSVCYLQVLSFQKFDFSKAEGDGGEALGLVPHRALHFKWHEHEAVRRGNPALDLLVLEEPMASAAVLKCFC